MHLITTTKIHEDLIRQDKTKSNQQRRVTTISPLGNVFFTDWELEKVTVVSAEGRRERKQPAK